MPQSRNFNDTIQADVFYLKINDRKWAALSLVDVATRFMAACWTTRPLTPMSWLLRRCGFDTSSPKDPGHR